MAKDTLLLAAIGMVIGVVAALWITRWISSLLFGIQPTDPVAIAAAVLLLAAVALLAAWIPARHATKVDPLQALRYE